MKIKLQNVRLSFPKIFVAEQFEGQGPFKFSTNGLLDAESPIDAKQIKALKKAMRQVGSEKWGKAWDDGKIKLIGTCLKAQDEDLHSGDKLVTETKGDDREEQNGMYIVTASDTTRPQVRDKDKSPLVESDGKPYAGCYATLIIDLWAQDNKFGKRINANLTGVQFKKDGAAFAGGVPASDDDFDDDFEDDDENDDQFD
ncbi:MAG: DUF2815 family protein [Planctomycetes bacterium]|nr:DUF2815 family protein [Planctomycetota bacterium]